MREAVGVIAFDGVADGFAPAVVAESIAIFVLGDVDGLHERLGQVGDGAGSSRFYIAADHGGDETRQGGAEIAGGKVVAGEEVVEIFPEFLCGAGAGFFLGMVEAEVRMVADARSAATAAIRECKRTQGHAVLCIERGHRSLLRLSFWDCWLKRGQAPDPVEINSACANYKKKTPARCRRYKHGPKTGTPRLEPGRTFQQRYYSIAARRVESKNWGARTGDEPSCQESALQIPAAGASGSTRFDFPSACDLISVFLLPDD